MATIAQSRVLSTPAVYISGILIKIVPNSFEYHMGNGSVPRAVSSGGGGIDIVDGIDASKLLCKIKFDIASTAENVTAVRNWINNANNSVQETLLAVEQGEQVAFDQMYLSGDIVSHWKSDGNTTVEWMGRYVA